MTGPGMQGEESTEGGLKGFHQRFQPLYTSRVSHPWWRDDLSDWELKDGTQGRLTRSAVRRPCPVILVVERAHEG